MVFRCYGDAADDGLAGFHLWEGDVQATVHGFGGDDALQRTAVAGLGPGVKVVDDGLAVDGDIEDAQAFIICRLGSIPSVPGFHEIEFYTVFTVGDGQVVPQAVATEAEELEQLVALGAADVGADVALAGLESMNTLEVLSPGVADDAVVGLPLLSVLVAEGIAAAVDAIEVVVAVGGFQEVAVAVGGGG